MKVLTRLALVALLFAVSAPLRPAHGADPEEKPDDSITHQGFTGLFNLISPDTLDSGQVSAGMIGRNYDRENSDLDVNDLSAAFAIGVMNRLELGFAYVADRQMDFDDATTTEPYNNFPFPISNIDRGGGDMRMGLKVSLVRMEEKGSGLALFSNVKLPTGNEELGRSTGGTDFKVGLAGGFASRQVGFYGNAAYTFVGDAKLNDLSFDIADEFSYGAGVEFGARHWLSGIIEMSGETFLNKPEEFPRQDSALDLAVGFKIGGARHGGLSLGASYVRNLTMQSERADGQPTRPDGAIVELSFTTSVRPPPPPEPIPAPSVMNHPPTCTLTLSPKEVYPAFSPKPHVATVSAQGSDPDGDRLEYSWSASGGSVSGSGASVSWSGGERVEDGTFTVTATVKDGKGGEGTCSETVRVKPDPEWFDGRVQFEFDRYDLTAEARAVVNRAADHLKRHGSLKVSIEGHTCYIATEEYNMALGQQRAEAIRAALVALGVDATRLSALTFGETRPWQDNTRELTRRLNRRGEFRFRFSE